MTAPTAGRMRRPCLLVVAFCCVWDSLDVRLYDFVRLFCGGAGAAGGWNLCWTVVLVCWGSYAILNVPSAVLHWIVLLGVSPFTSLAAVKNLRLALQLETRCLFP